MHPATTPAKPRRTVDDQIAATQAKLKTLQARKESADARALAKLAGSSRNADTRRKLLVGVAVLAEIDADPGMRAWLDGVLGARLTRPDDRALFGLVDAPPVVEVGELLGLE